MIARTISLLVWLLAPVALAAEPISYNQDVLPILAEHCFSCHGFDKAARQAELRLDRREDALKVLTKNEAKSLLVERVCSTNDDERMPPVDTGKPLSTLQIDVSSVGLMKERPYEPHWAWLPPHLVVSHRQLHRVRSIALWNRQLKPSDQS